MRIKLPHIPHYSVVLMSDSHVIRTIRMHGLIALLFMSIIACVLCFALVASIQNINYANTIHSLEHQLAQTAHSTSKDNTQKTQPNEQEQQRAPASVFSKHNATEQSHAQSATAQRENRTDLADQPSRVSAIVPDTKSIDEMIAAANQGTLPSDRTSTNSTQASLDETLQQQTGKQPRRTSSPDSPLQLKNFSYSLIDANTISFGYTIRSARQAKIAGTLQYKTTLLDGKTLDLPPLTFEGTRFIITKQKIINTLAEFPAYLSLKDIRSFSVIVITENGDVLYENYPVK